MFLFKLRPIDTKNDKLVFETINKNEVIIGNTEVPLSSIKNQEENDLELENISENNENEAFLTLKLKLTLIWNFVEKYTLDYEMITDKSKKSNEMYYKTKEVKDNLGRLFEILSCDNEKNMI